MKRAKAGRCELCGGFFSQEELFPLLLFRKSLLDHAKKQAPSLSEKGFCCLEDYRKLQGSLFEELLKKERGEISRLEQEVIDSIKEHDLLTENINEEFEEALSFGERMSDRLAFFAGSWKFLLLFFLIMAAWMGANSLLLLGGPFDPYPYILLNLALSCLAALQAPVIMMSQNRQSARDRLQIDHDYAVNLKAEFQIRQLSSRVDHFMRHYWQKHYELLRLKEEILEIVEGALLSRDQKAASKKKGRIR